MTPTMNLLLELIIACSLLVGVSIGCADASGLLPEGSLPPTFSLPDRHGHTVRLQTFLHSRRIVLLFNPGATFLADVERKRSEFEERDMTVLAIVPSGSAVGENAEGTPVVFLIDAQADVAHLYGTAPGSPTFYLIGKDGHIAAAQRGYPSLRELFGTIDAMPMRRAEMRERGER